MWIVPVLVALSFPAPPQQHGGPHHDSAGPGSSAPPVELPLPVRGYSKLSNATSGFPDTLDQEDYFGRAACALGDLDGDGVPDVAVGAPDDDDSPGPALGPGGAVWVLFLMSDGTVRARQKISAVEGGLQGLPGNYGRFGSALASLGDLGGDGLSEIAVGEPGDWDGGPAAGAVWILSLRPDGTVAHEQKISALAGGFGGTLEFPDTFGASVSALGDLDGDGLTELGVGASGDGDGGGFYGQKGAFWVLFLNPDGTVHGQQKISQTEGGFTDTLSDFAHFGSAAAGLGDLDGDGRPEVAVSSPYDGFSAATTGALWILSLEADGTVGAARKIGDATGGFTGDLDVGDSFGWSLARLGDADGNGVPELLVGATGDGDGGPAHGAVWILYLAADGTVTTQRKISDTAGGFTGALSNQDLLGSSMAPCGDLDLDGATELVVGAMQDDDGGLDHGAVWVMFLQPDESVRAFQKISDGQGGFLGTLDASDGFGLSMAALGDLDGDGVEDYACGVPGDDDSTDVYASYGGIYVLFMNADGSVRTYTKIGRNLGGFTGRIDDRDQFAYTLVVPGDLDGDGIVELAAAAPWDDDGGGGSITERGAVWVLYLNRDGTVRRHQKISATEGGLGSIQIQSVLGFGLTALGDFDGDGVGDVLATAPGEGVYDIWRGALWILLLNPDGTVKDKHHISAVEGGFGGDLDYYDGFAQSVAALGDLDGDGVTDVAVGAPADTDGSPFDFYQRGAIWILFLNADGTVKTQQKISALEGGFRGLLEDNEGFGGALARIDDIDADGVPELATGTFEYDGHYGGAWEVLHLRADGTVKYARKVKSGRGGLGRVLENGDNFGRAALSLGDLGGDGLPEVFVGAPGDDDGANDHGALWRLELDGLVRAGFERERDLRTPLADGQSLAAHQAYEPLFSLSGSGANLGPALFDSAPGGPNGARPDLLVGRGNLLLLQDSSAPAQGTPGVFDQPAPDPDGGRLRFFFAGPRRLLSLDLVDIDATTSATVSMVDRKGASRIFRVPAGWTGDRVADGTSGVGTLDLNDLDPQPGFASTARITMSAPDFDEDDVERLIVLLEGGGAVDALVLDPYP